jgi:putative SOS response-associated peptidase YedK
MCGRFFLLTDLSVIMERFAVEGSELAALPAGDLVPGQLIPAVLGDGGNRLVALRWGLIPAWAKDPAVGRKLFNARAETIAEKPSFKNAFKHRRCLIPADGFYEWTGEKGQKQAIRFFLRSGEPFGFAGLYETWRPPSGEAIRTCTIVTTEPNGLIAPVHDRMPVILPREKEALWLDPAVHAPEALRPLLSPYPAEEMAIPAHHQPCRGPL